MTEFWTKTEGASRGPELVPCLLACSPGGAAAALAGAVCLTLILTLALVPFLSVRAGGVLQSPDAVLQAIAVPGLTIQEIVFCGAAFCALCHGMRVRRRSAYERPFTWRRLLLGRLSVPGMALMGALAGMSAAAAAGLALLVTQWACIFAGVDSSLVGPGDTQLLGALHLLDRGGAQPGMAALALVLLWAPVSEELLFRGVLFAALRDRIGPLKAAAISALVFAALHFSPVDFLALAAIGFILAMVYTKTGSLGAAMIAHAANNFIALELARRAGG